MYLQATVGSQRRFSLVKVLLLAQPQLRPGGHLANVGFKPSEEGDEILACDPKKGRRAGESDGWFLGGVGGLAETGSFRKQ
jgi:hypothetical protein